MVHIKMLADENLVSILEYLRATDLATVREVDKTVFQKLRVSKAVKFQIENIYSTTTSPTKEKRLLSIAESPMSSPGFNGSEYGCDVLYVREIKSILTALTSPVPMNGKGYWISTSWLANAKKYFEALNLPDIGSGRKAGAKKMGKIRQRRGSDSLPPWPSMNVDIVCEHQNLALTKGLRAKRRLIDSKYWYFLRKFYPVGPEFKSRMIDCCVCAACDEQKKVSATLKKEEGLKVRRICCLSGPLESLSLRRNGVPSHLLSQKTPSGFKSDLNDNLSCSESAAAAAAADPEDSISQSSSPFQSALLDSIISSSSSFSCSHQLSLPPSPSPPPLPSPLSLSLFDLPSPFISPSIPYPISTFTLTPPPSLPNVSTSFHSPECPISILSWSQPHTPMVPSTPFSQPLPNIPAVLPPGWSQPLVPGLYHLVPRSWLKSWRLFNKNLSVTYVPPLDCTSMLCQSHGFLVVPNHVNEYLVGLKRTLLGGLGSYDGDVFEILSTEEWDSLQFTLNSFSDFSVKFRLDGENILWNIRICQECSSDSFAFDSKLKFQQTTREISNKWSVSK